MLHPIIREIRKKLGKDDYSTPIKIGVEQRFVSPLINSNNNNLEEQSIIGNDCLTIEWTDTDGVQYIVKKYCDGDFDSSHHKGDAGYYILFIKDFTGSTKVAEFYFDGKKICLPQYNVGQATFDDYNKTLKLDSNDIYSFSQIEEDDNVKLNIIPPYTVNKEETLCFRTNWDKKDDIILDDATDDYHDTLISRKVTSKMSTANKSYTKETIYNYLGNENNNNNNSGE